MAAPPRVPLGTTRNRNHHAKSATPVAMSSWMATATLLLVTLISNACAYIPASPSNDTSFINSESFIQINWLPMGISAYTNALSRQLVNSQGVNGYRGALVHFSQENATTGTDTSAAWIALISCDDATLTFSSRTDPIDILSSAKNMGSQAAILYSSEMGATCQIEQSFAAAFNGSMDVYVTTSMGSASSINQQFSNVASEAYWWNATALTDSASTIQEQISQLPSPSSASTSPSLFGPTGEGSSASASPSTSPAASSGTAVNYLIATISNANNDQVGTTQEQTSNRNSSANTGLAMIILYAITGVVTLLFLVVIMSGAVRAMRHPERYGPRARNANAPGDHGQSRAGGLTKAILDTFPVVKYLSGQGGSGTNRENRDAEGQATPKDEETGDAVSQQTTRANGSEDIQMNAVRTNRQGSPSVERVGGQEESPEDGHIREISEAATLAVPSASQHAKEGTSDTTRTMVGESSEGPKDTTTGAPAFDSTDPADVNDSITCPICLLDFEDGDDIRILPCDSRHRFHDACVVPWLLNVSSLCPLCRLDLAKNDAAQAVSEDPASENGTDHAQHHRASSSGALANIRARFTHNRNSAVPPLPNTSEDAETDGAAAGTAQDQMPSRSRFLRYVQQTRTRVRARANSRRDSVSVPRAGAPPAAGSSTSS